MGGRTWAPIVAALSPDADIQGDLVAVHLHEGRAYVLMASTTKHTIHELDLAEARIGAALPGQAFGGARGQQLD